jgi:hypothetical protein
MLALALEGKPGALTLDKDNMQDGTVLSRASTAVLMLISSTLASIWRSRGENKMSMYRGTSAEVILSKIRKPPEPESVPNP